MITRLLFGLMAGGFCLRILLLLRADKLKERQAVWWLIVGGGILLLAAYPGLLDLLARWAGVAVPANLLFFVAIFLLLIVSVQLSVDVALLEKRTRVLCEESALLAHRLDARHEHDSGALAPTDRDAVGNGDTGGALRE